MHSLAGTRGLLDEKRQAAAAAAGTAMAVKRSVVSIGAVQGDDGRERVVILTEVPEVRLAQGVAVCCMHDLIAREHLSLII